MTDAVTHLRAIREQWGDLLTAIARPPVADWPPRQPSIQHLTRDPDLAGPQVGRLPLVLREHPAPLNLTALDAALSIEVALFALADRIAAAVQRPVRTRRTHHPDGGSSSTTYRPTHRPSRTDRDDPDRWHFPTNRDIGGRADARPGSRALGLHWAAVWIEQRLDQTERTDLHDTVRGVLRDHAEQVAAAAHRDMQRALGRDGRTTVAPAPCPWCHGTLTLHATSGNPDDMTITCETGPSCTAPSPARYDDHARRMWTGRDPIAALTIAILHAQNREPTA